MKDQHPGTAPRLAARRLCLRVQVASAHFSNRRSHLGPLPSKSIKPKVQILLFTLQNMHYLTRIFTNLQMLSNSIKFFTWTDPYLVLTLFPTRSSSTAVLPPNVLAKLSDSERVGWQWLSTKGKTKSSDYAAANGVDIRTASRHLHRFLELGLIEATGAGRATLYEVI